MNRRILLIYLTVTAILAGFLGITFGRYSVSAEEDMSKVGEGIGYILSQEKKDPAEVQDEIKAIRKARREAEREARRLQLVNGEVDVFTLFEDYVLMGDSRAVGYSYYKYMPSDRVIAQAGATILEIENHYDVLAEMNPSYIYFCYGLNDISIGFWPTPESYVEKYTSVLQTLRERLPDTVFVVSSILPARDPAFKKASAWYQIPEYSAAVKQMCAANGWLFADNDKISEEYANLWDIDGIHLQYAFYPHWAANLIMAVLEADEPGEDEEEL